MPGKLVGAIDFPGGKRFEVSIYDLLYEDTDVIVNAANGGLLTGEGSLRPFQRLPVRSSMKRATG